MIDIADIIPGNSYACKFRVETMLDTLGRPAPNLADVPVKGVGVYEGLGILLNRDTENQLVRLQDQQSRKTFVVAYADIWDVDTVEWVDEL